MRAHQQGASRFYEGGKNAHLRFMSLSKMRIAIYEGHMRLHVRLNCRGVAPMPKFIGRARIHIHIFANLKNEAILPYPTLNPTHKIHISQRGF